MGQRFSKRYQVLFNHDGFCLFSNASPYQRFDEPVGLAQVRGYVDEVADAGVDCLLLCPNMYQQPGWDSRRVPYWRERGRTRVMPDTAVGKVMSRFREFLLAGHDHLAVSRERAKERGLAFFLTWRMNESHGLNDLSCPSLSDFYLAHPEYRIGEGATHSWEKLALSFAHREVREYQLGLIEELLSRYEVDGLELDLLRFPWLFPASMPEAEKFSTLTGFLREVRGLLGRQGDRPLGVRVYGWREKNRRAGFDVEGWVHEGLVDLVNLSPFYTMSSEMEIEDYRRTLPGAALYAEATQCTAVERHIELSVEQSRKSTTEILRSFAHASLDRGADGISLFNYVYYRDYSFGNPLKLDKCEPNFAALPGLTDRARLSREDKHYVFGFSPEWPKNYPRVLVPGKAESFRIYVADGLPDHTVRRALLRLQASASWGARGLRVAIGGKALAPARHEGELFPQPYREGIPANHDLTLDFEVPAAALSHGWNAFEALLEAGDAIEVRRVELALYRGCGRASGVPLRP